MSRRLQRGFVLAFFFAFAGLLIVYGLHGGLIRLMPAHYVGYGVGGIGILGLLGFNIWLGGPLDKRNDPPEQPPHDQWDNT